MNKEYSNLTYELISQLTNCTEIDPLDVPKETIEIAVQWIGIVAQEKIEELKHALRNDKC